MTRVTIGEGVNSIGEGAFAGCESLKTVYYRGREEEWNEIEIGRYNDKLEDAEIVFNYKGEWDMRGGRGCDRVSHDFSGNSNYTIDFWG